jgi:hypothetical protein
MAPRSALLSFVLYTLTEIAARDAIARGASRQAVKDSVPNAN